MFDDLNKWLHSPLPIWVFLLFIWISYQAVRMLEKSNTASDASIFLLQQRIEQLEVESAYTPEPCDDEFEL